MLSAAVSFVLTVGSLFREHSKSVVVGRDTTLAEAGIEGEEEEEEEEEERKECQWVKEERDVDHVEWVDW